MQLEMFFVEVTMKEHDESKFSGFVSIEQHNTNQSSLCKKIMMSQTLCKIFFLNNSLPPLKDS